MRHPREFKDGAIYHVGSEVKKGNDLSKIMQWVKGNFARYWNKMHNQKGGHLWGKRFFSKIINDVRQLFAVFNYIDKNPQKAGMVKHAEDWKFGGLYHDLYGRTDMVDVPRTSILELFFLGKVIVGKG